MRLVWSDEFDGPAGTPVDPNVWGFEVGDHGWGNDELQRYTDDAVLDGAGCLAITARRTPEGGYTSARLVSKGRVAVRHGLVVARIRLPGGLGVWPAFWMLGTDIDEVGWPGCGEIDVMEHFGTGSDTVRGTVHGPGYSGRDGVTGATSVGAGFHDHAVRWSPGRIEWLLDGRPFHAVTPNDVPGPWVFEHDFYLLLNVAVGGTLTASPAGTGFPRTMLVDHVRVYAADG